MHACSSVSRRVDDALCQTQRPSTGRERARRETEGEIQCRACVRVICTVIGDGASIKNINIEVCRQSVRLFRFGVWCLASF